MPGNKGKEDQKCQEMLEVRKILLTDWLNKERPAAIEVDREERNKDDPKVVDLTEEEKKDTL